MIIGKVLFDFDGNTVKLFILYSLTCLEQHNKNLQASNGERR